MFLKTKPFSQTPSSETPSCQLSSTRRRTNLMESQWTHVTSERPV